MEYDQIVAVSRLTKDPTNNNKESYQLNAALQDVKCQLQPASPEMTAIADGVFAQTYIMFTTTSGILPGDKITVSGTGDTLRIKGIEDWSQIEGIPHYEMTLVKMMQEEVIV